MLLFTSSSESYDIIKAAPELAVALLTELDDIVILLSILNRNPPDSSAVTVSIVQFVMFATLL